MRKREVKGIGTEREILTLSDRMACSSDRKTLIKSEKVC